MERAIRFKDEMVRAILDGRKTQTRRPLKPQPEGEWGLPGRQSGPYGRVGDVLWVQEVFATNLMGTHDYRASVHPEYHPDFSWRSSAQMPRNASRIDLSITGLRIEKLQDISRGDCMAEGCPFPNMEKGENPVDWFAGLWDEIYAKKGYPWQSNPWVYVIDFKVMT
jgi:hypothetical protein